MNGLNMRVSPTREGAEFSPYKLVLTFLMSILFPTHSRDTNKAVLADTSGGQKKVKVKKESGRNRGRNKDVTKTNKDKFKKL